MIRATKWYVIVQRIPAPPTGLQEIQVEKPNKGLVHSAYNGPDQELKQGDFVYYIPHSELKITIGSGEEYFAVPETDIVALVRNEIPWEA